MSSADHHEEIGGSGGLELDPIEEPDGQLLIVDALRALTHMVELHSAQTARVADALEAANQHSAAAAEAASELARSLSAALLEAAPTDPPGAG